MFLRTRLIVNAEVKIMKLPNPLATRNAACPPGMDDRVAARVSGCVNVSFCLTYTYSAAGRPARIDTLRESPYGRTVHAQLAFRLRSAYNRRHTHSESQARSFFLKIPECKSKSFRVRALSDSSLHLSGILCLPVCGISPLFPSSKLSSRLSFLDRPSRRPICRPFLRPCT